MKAEKARKAAAQLLKTGKSKIWIDQSAWQKIKEAMTKEDLRNLIRDGIVKKKKENQQSRARARILHEKKKKRRKTGEGKRTGSKKARTSKKKKWMRTVRAQRSKLIELKNSKVELKIPYRKAYEMIKGNFFRGKKHLEAALTGAKK